MSLLFVLLQSGVAGKLSRLTTDHCIPLRANLTKLPALIYLTMFTWRAWIWTWSLPKKKAVMTAVGLPMGWGWLGMRACESVRLGVLQNPGLYSGQFIAQVVLQYDKGLVGQ
jgi:hypothetical protein